MVKYSRRMESDRKSVGGRRDWTLWALKMAAMLELYIIPGRFTVLLQRVNAGFQWPAEADTVISVHVVGLKLPVVSVMIWSMCCALAETVFSVLELSMMLHVEVLLCQGWLIWLSETVVPVVLFYPYLCRLLNLANVDLTTLMWSAAHTYLISWVVLDRVMEAADITRQQVWCYVYLYLDAVNVVSENMHSIMKNTKTLIVAAYAFKVSTLFEVGST